MFFRSIVQVFCEGLLIIIILIIIIIRTKPSMAERILNYKEYKMNKEQTMLWIKKYPECRKCKCLDVKIRHYQDYQIITECVNKHALRDNNGTVFCANFSRKEKQ